MLPLYAGGRLEKRFENAEIEILYKTSFQNAIIREK